MIVSILDSDDVKVTCDSCSKVVYMSKKYCIGLVPDGWYEECGSFGFLYRCVHYCEVCYQIKDILE